jgi:uncharacterized protein YbcC (UPF0753/DUF2309 family)
MASFSGIQLHSNVYIFPGTHNTLLDEFALTHTHGFQWAAET